MPDFDRARFLELVQEEADQLCEFHELLSSDAQYAAEKAWDRMTRSRPCGNDWCINTIPPGGGEAGNSTVYCKGACTEKANA